VPSCSSKYIIIVSLILVIKEVGAVMEKLRTACGGKSVGKDVMFLEEFQPTPRVTQYF